MIQIDVPTLEEKMEARRQLLYVNVPKINPNPKYRMKGKSGSAQMAKRKMIKRDVHRTRYLNRIDRLRNEAGIDAEGNDLKSKPKPAPKDKHREQFHENIMDRFKN